MEANWTMVIALLGFGFAAGFWTDEGRRRKKWNVNEEERLRLTAANVKVLAELDSISQAEIKSVNETARDDFYSKYLELVEREKSFTLFFRHHFQEEWEMAEAKNQHTYFAACNLLLQNKQSKR